MPNQQNDPSVVKKGLVVIHGAGHQRQSDTIQFMGSPLIEWINRWVEAHDRTLRVNQAGLRFGSDDDDPQQAPPHVHATLGSIDEDGDSPIGDVDSAVDRTGKQSNIEPFDWTVAETWWAWSAISPPLVAITIWLAKYCTRAIWAGIRNMLAHASSLWREILSPDVPIDTRYGLQQATPRWVVWLDLVITVMTLALAPVVIVVGILTVVVAVLLSQVPIEAVQNFALVGPLASFLTVNGGQIYILTNDEIQAANFRGRLERTIRWLDTQGCQEIYVMAHSLGSIVSYETLCTLGDIWLPDPDAKTVPNVVKLFTMADGLNLAWRLQPAQWWKYPHQWRLFVPLKDTVHWFDFWSEQDPVPSGRVRIPPLVQQHLQADAGRYPRQSARKSTFALAHPEKAEADTDWMGPDKEVRVTNWMDLIADHGGYWDNDEEVLSRVACEIESGRQDNVNESQFYEEWYAKSGRAARRARVALLTGIRLTFYALLFAAVLQPKTQDMGHAVMNGLAQLPGLQTIANVAHQAITTVLSWLHWDSNTPAVGGVGWIFYVLPAVLVLLVPTILLYNVLARTFWLQWDRRQSIERMRLAAQFQIQPGEREAESRPMALIGNANASEKPWYWGWLAAAFAMPALTAAVGVVFLQTAFVIGVLETAVVLFFVPPVLALSIWAVVKLGRLLQWTWRLIRVRWQTLSQQPPPPPGGGDAGSKAPAVAVTPKIPAEEPDC